MSYAFEVGDKVYPKTKRVIYFSTQLKHRQGLALEIIAQFKDELGNKYVVKDHKGTFLFAKEETLTKNKEKVLGWIVFEDENTYKIYDNEPEADCKKVCVMGVL